MMLRWLDKLREEWAQLGLGVRVILWMLGIGLIALVAGPPLRGAARSFSLSRNLGLADSALAAGDATQARSRSMAVLQMDSDRIEAIRILARSMDLLRDSKRVQTAAFLFNHAEASLADREFAFGVLARNAPLSMAGTFWVLLKPAEQAEPATVDVFARRLLAEGKAEQATLLLRGMDLENPPDIITVLLLDLLASKGGADAWAEIQKRLIQRAGEAASANSPVPVWCLEQWERVPQNLLDPAALRVIPDDGAPRMQMLRRRLIQGTAALDADDPEIARWLHQTLAADRLALARLLGHCGLYPLAVQILEQGSPVTADEYEWLRRNRMRLLEWREWRDFLKSSAVSNIPRVLVRADLAVVCASLREFGDSNAAWAQVMLAAKSLGGAVRLTDISRRVRDPLPQRSHEAMIEAIRTGSEALPAFGDLTSLMVFLSEAGRDKELLEICRAYLKIEASNPLLITRYAYLGLLAGELAPEAAMLLVGPVIDYQASSPHPRVVAVLASLLNDDPEEALRWLGRDQVQWESAPPFYRWLVALAEKPASPPPVPAKSSVLPSEWKAITRLKQAGNE
ncbi:MAG: hypothetical protein WED15_07535 [Akkermansiaceae bacterium]